MFIPSNEYATTLRRKWLVLLILTVFLIMIIIGAAKFGTIQVTNREIIQGLLAPSVESTNLKILRDVRFPRIGMDVFTGIALAGAGVIMQAILRNPLASPFTLGVSSGASFGAALAIVLGTSLFGIKSILSSSWLIATNAFVFGCLSILLVYVISSLKNHSGTVLLLAGVAFSYLFSSGVSALKYISKNDVLKDLIVWLMGSTSGTNWSEIELIAPVTLIGMLIIMCYSWQLNVLALGEEIARTSGIRVKQLRLVSLFTVTVISSITIAFTGVIGFVGLVAPHVARMIIGVDHRFLIPASCLIGAILLLLSDTLARSLFSPVEIPVGIVTSIIGVPFFIYLLISKKREYWN